MARYEFYEEDGSSDREECPHCGDTFMGDYGDRKRVRFAEPASGSTAYQYFLEAPAGAGETNYYEFGPAEIGIDGEWRTVTGTDGDAFVVGVET